VANISLKPDSNRVLSSSVRSARYRVTSVPLTTGSTYRNVIVPRRTIATSAHCLTTTDLRLVLQHTTTDRRLVLQQCPYLLLLGDFVAAASAAAAAAVPLGLISFCASCTSSPWLAAVLLTFFGICVLWARRRDVARRGVSMVKLCKRPCSLYGTYEYVPVPVLRPSVYRSSDDGDIAC
jgi:hypothetical protein